MTDVRIVKILTTPEGRTIAFRVAAIPIAQPRQRTRVMMIGGKPLATNYTPQKAPVNAFKAAVAMAAHAAYSGPPLTGPLRVDLVFVFPRPKYMIWKTKPMPRVLHTSKPDKDNLEKSFADSLKKLTWVDDAQICMGWFEKWYAAGSEAAHVEVEITELCPSEVRA